MQFSLRQGQFDVHDLFKKHLRDVGVFFFSFSVLSFNIERYENRSVEVFNRKRIGDGKQNTEE